MSNPTKPAFEVDKEGLAKLLARRGRQFIALELWQNAADEEGTTEIAITFNREGDRWRLTVEDDHPEGFADLRHAYTLFAESAKKADTQKRGRFNLGEKLVVAVCDEAEISTTKGVIRWSGEEREHGPATRKAGSVFTGLLSMSATEATAVEPLIDTLIVPEGVTTTFNGRAVRSREPLKTFSVTLRTEVADVEGYLRPTRRKTTVCVYEPRHGETASIYEMGIPVVETGDSWSVDVGQKVPLTTDRDNVPPGWLRDIRAAVLNACADLLQPEQAQAKWVDDALEDEAIEPEAVKAAVIGRYGDKAVIEDPSDREGTKLAVSKGMTVIPAGAFSKPAWKAVKAYEIVKPAGQVTPSPKPHEGEEGLDLMEPEHYPEGVRTVVDYAKVLAVRLLDAEINVRVANAVTWPYAATYGPRAGGDEGQLTLNYGSLGYNWFKDGRTAQVDALLVHEFGHHYPGADDHLSHKYHDALCDLAARLAQVALDEPELLLDYELTDPAGRHSATASV